MCDSITKRVQCVQATNVQSNPSTLLHSCIRCLVPYLVKTLSFPTLVTAMNRTGDEVSPSICIYKLSIPLMPTPSVLAVLQEVNAH